MLAISLHPVQPQRVQERRQSLHHTQNGEREEEPHRKHDENHDCLPDKAGCGEEGVLDRHGVEHFG